MRPSLLLTLALVSCTPTVWNKPGTDPETQKADFGACHALAQEKIARPAPQAPSVQLSPIFGSLDGPIRPADRSLDQQQLVDTCMRGKGYRLEPVAR